ncbi:MAG: CDP-glycerol glycerophosphotransferase family protein [Treponema sp.]|nr:CDP-glycerol glycerophosphotransferase family protein [Treponema sp.]
MTFFANIKHFLKDSLGTIAYSFMCLFKINPKKIVFSNYWGYNGYTDSLKYISLELKKLDSSLEMIWLVKNLDTEFPSYIKKIKFNSIKSFYHLATAKVWIDNQRKSYFVRKRKSQYYIQTWHGSIGFKRIELDCLDSYNNKRYYLKSRKHDTSMIDLFLSGNNWFDNTIRRAFDYKKEILTLGTPRNDILVSKNYDIDIQKIKTQIGIPINKKILFYAPTFRKDETDMSNYLSDIDNFRNKLSTEMKEDWIVLVRLHPRMMSLAKKIHYSENVINVSTYSDIQELLLLADILVTDYSSCIFDFALQYKPGFIFAKDLEDFRKDRNFYFDIENSPFLIAKTENELIYNIKNFNQSDYKTKLDNFFNSIGLKETGTASQRVAEIIKNKISDKG